MHSPIRRTRRGSKRDMETYFGPGVAMRRDGRFMDIVSTLTPEEHAKMIHKLGESVSSLIEDMNADVDVLYKVLHRYKAEYVVSALWFRNAPLGVVGEHVEEVGADNRMLSYVEYVATLYLIDPGAGEETIILPHVIEDIQSRVSGLFMKTIWLYIAQDAARYGNETRDTLRALRFMTLMNSLVVRYPGYFDHMVDSLRGIETALNKDLVEILGWNIEDAIRVGKTLIELIDVRLTERFGCYKDAMTALYEQAWPHGKGPFQRFVKNLLPPQKRPWLWRRYFEVSAWLMSLMKDITIFTPEELAESSGVSVERVEHLLEAAALPWGSCDPKWYRLPSPTPPLITRPVVKLENRRFLVPVPTSFLWAIRPLIEDLLKKNAKESGSTWWDAYETARSEYLESEAMRLLAKALPHGKMFRSLKYSWIHEGQQVYGQLDGLLLLQDIAILVEAKAGTMSPAGRRGAPNGMQEDLDTLVGEAHRQALRARDFMQSSPTVIFTLPNHQSLKVEASRIKEYILITVTLDALDTFTTMVHQLMNLDVVGKHDLPWAVSLHNLFVITDAIEFPAQFIHYLKRRARLNDLKMIVAYDELDWFAHYLKEGLYFEHVAESITDQDHPIEYNIVGYSKLLDAHYMHDARYPCEAPPVPRQPMPEDMRALLKELEDSHPPGYIHVSIALLDLDWETRERFTKNMMETVKRSRLDGHHHDFTMLIPEGSIGLTFMADNQRDRLQKNLLSYCKLKKYQARFFSWVGIGKLVQSDNYVDKIVVIRQPWTYDVEMEKLVAKYLNPLPIRQE